MSDDPLPGPDIHPDIVVGDRPHDHSRGDRVQGDQDQGPAHGLARSRLTSRSPAVGIKIATGRASIASIRFQRRATLHFSLPPHDRAGRVGPGKSRTALVVTYRGGLQAVELLLKQGAICMPRAERRRAGYARSPPNRADRHVGPIFFCSFKGRRAISADLRAQGRSASWRSPGVSTLIDSSCNLFGVRKPSLTVGKPACLGANARPARCEAETCGDRCFRLLRKKRAPLAHASEARPGNAVHVHHVLLRTGALCPSVRLSHNDEQGNARSLVAQRPW